MEIQITTIIGLVLSCCAVAISFTLAITNSKRMATKDSAAAAAANATTEVTMNTIMSDVKDIKAEARLKADRDQKNHQENLERITVLEQHQKTNYNCWKDLEPKVSDHETRIVKLEGKAH